MQAAIENWNDLKHIDEAQGGASNDVALFDEIRQVLRKHQALSKYGVCLLHKHFDIECDEVLLETCDADKRTLTLRPIQRESVADCSVVQTVWSLEEGANSIAKCRLVCYKDEDGFHEKRHWP